LFCNEEFPPQSGFSKAAFSILSNLTVSILKLVAHYLDKEDAYMAEVGKRQFVYFPEIIFYAKFKRRR